MYYYYYYYYYYYWNTLGTFVFPTHICATDALPDGFVFSNKLKICVVLEVTSPLEENIPYWHNVKKAKYFERIVANLSSLLEM